MISQLVRKILERADQYEWTLQGFGMLRLYLGRVGRLHVWDDRYTVPGVSVVHDHAWDFASTVISGSLTNIVYRVSVESVELYGGSSGGEYWMQPLITGEGGGLIDAPLPVTLTREEFGLYGPGHARRAYDQQKHLVHETRATRGTVTLVERAEGEGAKTARVFWPAGDRWVSAEPRPATLTEVRDICDGALAGMVPL